jgi:DNA topoisomerase-1
MATRLVYCDDSKPGITRTKVRGQWAYWGPKGERITDRDEIDRLNRIGLPPPIRMPGSARAPAAISRRSAGTRRGASNIAITPISAKAQEAAKYERCAAFGRPARLRKRVEADLKKRGLCKDRAVAAVVRLLDNGHIRVGNEAYAATNKSFGATTA